MPSKDTHNECKQYQSILRSAKWWFLRPCKSIMAEWPNVSHLVYGTKCQVASTPMQFLFPQYVSRVCKIVCMRPSIFKLSRENVASYEISCLYVYIYLFICILLRCPWSFPPSTLCVFRLEFSIVILQTMYRDRQQFTDLFNLVDMLDYMMLRW